MKSSKNCQKMFLRIYKSIIYFILKLVPLSRALTYSKLYLAGKIWGGNVRKTSYSHIFRKQGFGRLCAQISLHKFKKRSGVNRIIMLIELRLKYLQHIYVYIVYYKSFICHSSKAYLVPFQTSIFSRKKIYRKCLWGS